MMSRSCLHLHCLWRQQHFIFDVPLRMHTRMGQPRCARSSCSSWSAKEMKSITDWFRNHAESYWIIQHPLKSVWWQMIQTYLPVHDSMIPWLHDSCIGRCNGVQPWAPHRTISPNRLSKAAANSSFVAALAILEIKSCKQLRRSSGNNLSLGSPHTSSTVRAARLSPTSVKFEAPVLAFTCFKKLNQSSQIHTVYVTLHQKLLDQFFFAQESETILHPSILWPTKAMINRACEKRL